MRWIPVLLIFVSGAATAQEHVPVHELELDSVSYYRFDLKDGSVVYGILEQSDVSGLTIRTKQMGTVIVQRGSVRGVQRQPIDPYAHPTRWFTSLESTNYLLLPSARPMDRGTVVYRNRYIGIQQVEVGVAKNISLASGIEFFSLFEEPTVPTFFAQMKTGFRVGDDVHLGFGATYVNSSRRSFLGYVDDTERRDRGAAYGLITYGDLNSHLTVGAGAAADQDEEVLFPFVSVAAVVRVSSMIALITENWIALEKETAYWSFGIRFLSDEISVDLAFLNNEELSEKSVIGYPYVGFAVGF